MTVYLISIILRSLPQMSLLAGMLYSSATPSSSTRITLSGGCWCGDQNSIVIDLMPWQYHCIERLDDDLRPVPEHKCLLYVIARDVAGAVIPDARIKVAVGKEVQAEQASSEGCAVFVLSYGHTAVDENIEITVTSVLYSAEEMEGSAVDLALVVNGETNNVLDEDAVKMPVGNEDSPKRSPVVQSLCRLPLEVEASPVLSGNAQARSSPVRMYLDYRHCSKPPPGWPSLGDRRPLHWSWQVACLDVVRCKEAKADSARDLKIIPIETLLACDSTPTIGRLASTAQKFLRESWFLPQQPEPPRNISAILLDQQTIVRSFAPPEPQPRRHDGSIEHTEHASPEHFSWTLGM